MNYINSLVRILKGPYIPVIRIQGPINQQTTMSISQQLKQINPQRCDYLSLVINSSGGSLCQTYEIQNEIKKYINKHELELLTFSQNQAVKEAFLLLNMGQRVICQKGSIIGYKQKQVSFYDCRQFIENNNLKVDHFKSESSASSIQSKLMYNGIDNQTLQQFQKFISNLNQMENTGIYLAGYQKQLRIQSMCTYDKYLLNLYPNAKVNVEIYGQSDKSIETVSIKRTPFINYVLDCQVHYQSYNPNILLGLFPQTLIDIY